MHDTNAPEPVDESVETEETRAAEDGAEAAVEPDGVLDGFEQDLDDVASALDALDADDLDTAESLVAGLAQDPLARAADTD